MGNWERQQEVQKEVKETDKTRRENLAKCLFDLTKITFTGLVVGGIASLFTNTTAEDKTYVLYVVSIGVILSFVFAWIGNRILKY